MLKIYFILYCMLPVILGVPLIEIQYELNEISDVTFSHETPTPEQLAKQAGYTAETHEVITEDRYVLQVHRIKGSGKSPPSKNKPVVLLFHGILDCSATWLLSGPEKGLGFILADWGYDVWMANARGNRYSRRHLDWTVSDREFWLFSWHEIGVYDYPATIDYILNTTWQKKLIIISHSQGGTAFFVMGSERPEYQKKIAAVFAMAPAVFMSRSENLLYQVLAPFANDIKVLTSLIGMYEFKPSDKLIQMLTKVMCSDDAITQPVCTNIIFVFGGFGDKELNRTLVPIIGQYDPAGASTRQFVHYGQSITTGKFRKFDYGLIGNKMKYGKIQPPNYNLANIKIPIYLYYGLNDVLVNVEDLHQLYDLLPTAQKFLVPYKCFTHLDFLWSKHVNVWVYDKILSLMERHKNETLIV
ncbi:Lipase 3 [Eufriesea mexicana]|uniref:Lipase n=2 Tax=Eufriesea mexicana TaxID=516756 RepID=A0A310SN77_9HYME|nr:Lipase 3 [Eufriesea mexicana]